MFAEIEAALIQGRPLFIYTGRIKQARYNIPVINDIRHIT